MSSIVTMPANYYQQFDADYQRDVPAEGYGGWAKAPLQFDLQHMAVVVMHALDCGTYEQYPGWHRAVEYIPRANVIAQQVLGPLLDAVRRSPLKIYHVVGGGGYYQHLPGYQRAEALALPAAPAPMRVGSDPTLEALHAFKQEHAHPGEHNLSDIHRGGAVADFLSDARPHDSEGIARNREQLAGLCRSDGVNHLVYVGFAINWCLLLSPGGMVEMKQHGLMCSTIREATTAVENRETARQELAKEIALWRVAMTFGFVFDLKDFLAGIADAATPEGSDTQPER